MRSAQCSATSSTPFAHTVGAARPPSPSSTPVARTTAMTKGSKASKNVLGSRVSLLPKSYGTDGERDDEQHTNRAFGRCAALPANPYAPALAP